MVPGHLERQVVISRSLPDTETKEVFKKFKMTEH